MATLPDDLDKDLCTYALSYARYFSVIFNGPFPLLSYELFSNHRSISEHRLAV